MIPGDIPVAQVHLDVREDIQRGQEPFARIMTAVKALASDQALVLRVPFEPRLQGLMPFCLTVDREAPAYLPAIFGPRGFAVLSRPELLPTVLVEVLRSLVTG